MSPRPAGLGLRTPWLLVIAASMAVHGALGAGLLAVRPPAHTPRVIVPIDVVVKEEPPPPPPPPPPAPEPEPQPPPVIAEPEVPREPVVPRLDVVPRSTPLFRSG